jgi:hypothetical protein
MIFTLLINNVNIYIHLLGKEKKSSKTICIHLRKENNNAIKGACISNVHTIYLVCPKVKISLFVKQILNIKCISRTKGECNSRFRFDMREDMCI